MFLDTYILFSYPKFFRWWQQCSSEASMRTGCTVDVNARPKGFLMRALTETISLENNHPVHQEDRRDHLLKQQQQVAQQCPTRKVHLFRS
ncbi:hypothetical protein CEXT_511961 [Caerostris extrusa]|uniref:Uncharacterized protein n=1 Tax=Caerostris extrusa TaxID=172846 RepID=A0AAV4RW81_CAEEX|nr:hypothetical protein CEXT_511961 [Caerostris extrusa]